MKLGEDLNVAGYARGLAAPEFRLAGPLARMVTSHVTNAPASIQPLVLILDPLIGMHRTADKDDSQIATPLVKVGSSEHIKARCDWAG